jgi:ankyrin repeat protein
MLRSRPDYGAIAILLLRLGADPRLPRGRFKSGIEYVVEAGRWDVFEVMVNHPRFDASQQDARGRYILHYLVMHAVSERLGSFLDDVPVDPNIQDGAGVTPLHLAASAGNTAMVRTLLNVPGIRLDLTDGQGRTPLGIATYWGMQSTALCFLEHSRAFPTPEEGQLSPLCFAAKHGDLDLCLRLLEMCKYENLHLHVDASGQGILHLAAINDWSHVLEQCLKKGDVHLNINQIDHSGGTALHSAARLGNTESCRVLIEHGANLQLQDRLGRTAAQVVADAGFRDTLMVLLRSGRIDPNQRDHQGRNLVHWAATLDCVDVMELILAIPGVELARRDGDGALPIDIAKRCMSARVGKYLGQEMQRRGIDPRWCVGYGWDMMYRSPEVQPGEEVQHQGSGRQSNPFAEWEKIHREYPEERWGLVVRQRDEIEVTEVQGGQRRESI